ncbi:ABC transporter permease [Clostridiaceae bacterium AF18-31LB]|nr:ABC transporter permease [Clostridiaceae bacterium AF18-31LB]RHW05378.1 ABC transporter permease [Clostridiaceae bacterium OF09-1]
MNKEKAIKFYNKYGIAVILLGLLIICSIMSPVFLSQANIVNLLSQIAVVTVITCGITQLIIAGQTDLSGGAIVALTGCICVGTYKNLSEGGMNGWLAGIVAVLAAVLVGMIVNFLSGVIITEFHAPAFIVTLAMMQAGRGVCYIYTGGTPIYNIGSISKLGQGRIQGILPYSVIIMVLCIIATWVILNRTRLGRYIYAVGGNPEAAKASGISAKKTIIEAYLIHGAFVGLAGALFMTRLNSGQPAEAVGLEFDAITAAVIGGASLSGGVGTIYGSIIGSMIIGVITNILTLKSVQSYYQMIITGLIIVISVILDIVTKGKKD